MFIYLFVITITVCLVQKKAECVCIRVCERERKVAEILCDNSE